MAFKFFNISLDHFEYFFFIINLFIFSKYIARFNEIVMIMISELLNQCYIESNSMKELVSEHLIEDGLRNEMKFV